MPKRHTDAFNELNKAADSSSLTVPKCSKSQPEPAETVAPDLEAVKGSFPLWPENLSRWLSLLSLHDFCDTQIISISWQSAC